jgi:hypothetical protein
VATEHRTEEELRRELASEREQLAKALGDVRAGFERRRRLVVTGAGVLVTAVAARTALKIARRLRDG